MPGRTKEFHKRGMQGWGELKDMRGKRKSKVPLIEPTSEPNYRGAAEIVIRAQPCTLGLLTQHSVHLHHDHYRPYHHHHSKLHMKAYKSCNGLH